MGQQGPDRACRLVGQRDSDYVRWPPLGQTQRPFGRRLASGEHGASAVDRQGSQKLVPALGNPRFRILPWIEIPNLGSHILAIVRRRLTEDWSERYNTTTVLIETFVETPRHTGAVYRASGWLHVGTTQGRGRYDRLKQYDKPKKNVWLRPLRKDWKRTLNR